MVAMNHYTYRVIWSDNEYIGQCDEFPSLSYLADGWKPALDGIKNLVKDVLNDELS